jgi:hypothetical protein
MDNNQRLAFTLGIIIAAIMLCCGTAFISFTYGQHIGYDTGFEASQEAAFSQVETQQQSRQSDYQAGYKAGQQAALKETGNRYNLHNPTYQEMLDFIAADKTNEHAYSEENFVCVDFSHEINNNAEEQGLRCAVVDIFYPEGKGHTIIAFDTIDKGLQFIEPQFDRQVKLEVGKSYSEVNGYKSPPGDDTLLRYLITW